MPKALMVVFLLAACSSSTPDGDDAPGIDAHVVTAGGTPLTVSCQPHTRTVMAADGSRSVKIQKYAVLDVGVEDQVLVSACYPAAYGVFQDPPCPAGSTCSGTTFPGSARDPRCFSSVNGLYVGGKLAIDCGYTTQQFNAAGVMTASSVVEYSNITATKLP